MANSNNPAALVGRVFIALLFLSSAFGKITNFEGTARFMESHGIPMAAALCAAAVVVEVLGGISLVMGFHARWGAAALVVFMVPVTLVFHLGAEQRIQFLKNLAIMGGLLQIAALGPGEWSLDRKQ